MDLEFYAHLGSLRPDFNVTAPALAFIQPIATLIAVLLAQVHYWSVRIMKVEICSSEVLVDAKNAEMVQKLIVCADGTWNDGDRTRTNVVKLHRALQTWHVEGVNQWVCCVGGVGMAFGEGISGGAFGYGLTRNILQGYYFLMDNYERGDQLYFFGFSRGAYTVRSLAGFIRNSGLLKKEHRDLSGRSAQAPSQSIQREPPKESGGSGILSKIFL